MWYLNTLAWSAAQARRSTINTCPDCSFKACPKANDTNGLCDLCDEASETRAAQIVMGHTMYKDKVDAKRELFRMSPIKYKM